MEKVKDIYKFNDRTLSEAFNRLAVEVNMLKDKNGYHSFAICGIDQGAGTTTIAINLAIAAGMTGWKTLFVDGDLRKKSEFKHLSRGEELGLSDYLAGNSDLQAITMKTDLEAMNFIPCGTVLDNPVSLLCGNRLNQFLEETSAAYDLIIWDTVAVNVSVDTTLIAAGADAVILVASQGQSRDALQNARRILTDADANIVGVVANGVDRDEYEKNYSIYKKKTGSTGRKK